MNRIQKIVAKQLKAVSAVGPIGEDGVDNVEGFSSRDVKAIGAAIRMSATRLAQELNVEGPSVTLSRLVTKTSEDGIVFIGWIVDIEGQDFMLCPSRKFVTYSQAVISAAERAKLTGGPAQFQTAIRAVRPGIIALGVLAAMD